MAENDWLWPHVMTARSRVQFTGMAWRRRPDSPRQMSKKEVEEAR